MSERDDDTSEHDEGEEEGATEPESVKPVVKKAERKAVRNASSKARSTKRSSDTRPSAREPAKAPTATPNTSRALVFAVVALAVGAAAGWFANEAKAKSKLQAASPAGSSAACSAWEHKLCASGGEESATCMQAKGASALLMPSSCEDALLNVPATLAKVKAARANCDSLANKLCTDVMNDPDTCKMIKSRSVSFPPEQCKEMLEHYDEVLTQVKMFAQQGGGMQPPPGQPQP